MPWLLPSSLSSKFSGLRKEMGPTELVNQCTVLIPPPKGLGSRYTLRKSYKMSFIITVLLFSRLVASDSVTVAHRLLHPWDFPGKSTGIGCHFLLQRIFLGTEPTSPALAGRFFIAEPLGKPINSVGPDSNVYMPCSPNLCLKAVLSSRNSVSYKHDLTYSSSHIKKVNRNN